MSERPDGLWAASSLDVIASRQNGKNGIVEARELYGAVILGESIIHTAHLFKTSRESYDRLLMLVEAEPDVKERLTWQVASPAMGYEMRFRGGGRVQFIARSRTSGRGLTGDLLVFDEAQDLDDDALGALLPTLSARPNPQAWYLGSAPGPASVVWQRRRTAGREGGSSDGAFFEISADPDADLDDVKAWRQANPSLGVVRSNGSGLTETAIRAERSSMSDEMFARERLSISDELSAAGGFIDTIAWGACADRNHLPTSRLAYALDVDTNAIGEEWCSIGCSDGDHVEVVTPPDAGPGLAWVVAAVVAKRDRFDELLVDPQGPAGKLIDPLESAGVTVRKVKAQEFVAACGQFVDAVTDRAVSHIDQPVLNRAVVAARRRDIGDGAWRLSRTRSGADISPLVAVALARWAGQHPAPSKPTFAY